MDASAQQPNDFNGYRPPRNAYNSGHCECCRCRLDLVVFVLGSLYVINGISLIVVYAARYRLHYGYMVGGTVSLAIGASAIALGLLIWRRNKSIYEASVTAEAPERVMGNAARGTGRVLRLPNAPAAPEQATPEYRPLTSAGESSQRAGTAGASPSERRGFQNQSRSSTNQPNHDSTRHTAGSSPPQSTPQTFEMMSYNK